jgi:hypothetical protein
MKQLFRGMGAALCGVLLLIAGMDAQAAPGFSSAQGVFHAQHRSYLLQADYWDSYHGRDYRCRKVWLNDDEWEMRCQKRHYPRRYSCEEYRGWNGDWKLRCHRRYDCGWRRCYD